MKKLTTITRITQLTVNDRRLLVTIEFIVLIQSVIMLMRTMNFVALI